MRLVHFGEGIYCFDGVFRGSETCLLLASFLGIGRAR